MPSAKERKQMSHSSSSAVAASSVPSASGASVPAAMRLLTCRSSHLRSGNAASTSGAMTGPLRFLLRFLLCPLLLVEEALLPIAAGLARVQAKDDKTSKKPAKKVARRTERLIAACVRRP